MADLWFDRRAFINCSHEKDETLKICQKTIVKTTDVIYGVPDIVSWDCKKVEGYTLIESLSAVQIDPENEIKYSQLVAYLFLELNDKIDAHTFLEVNNRLYQMELIDNSLIQRGVAIVQKFRLTETNLTSDL